VGDAAAQGNPRSATQRNRVWQTDFSEFETSGGRIWRICAVIDYATKYCLAITVTPTARGADALACLRLASPRPNGSSTWTICVPIVAS
jgi:transposase InsO family protein